MGTTWPVEHGGESSSIIEDDFQVLEKPAPVIAETDADGAGFAPVTEESLNHLGPGCFVLFRSCDASCWVEIVSIDGNVIGGRLHSELSSTGCIRQHNGMETVNFSRDQIKALGCDRYCWC